MYKVQFDLQGRPPGLLMHNAQLSDPLNHFTQKLKEANQVPSKRRTDNDHEMIAQAEMRGGLYFDPAIGPYLPGDLLMASLKKAAGLSRDGQTIVRGILEMSDAPLVYTGPRDIEVIAKDANFRNRTSVGVNASRVIRTRPWFREWSATFEAIIDETMLDLDDLQRHTETSGNYMGIGDWRPKFGKFTAVITKLGDI